MKTIKQEIKALAENQVFLKNQRKTVNLVGERVIEPSVAAYRAMNGKRELTHLYAAYALLRGKEPFEPKRKELSKKLVETLVEKYKVKETEIVA